MYKIMYVCTGNTCRSPMAEGILRKLLTEAGYKDVEVASAGVGTLDGYPATPSAVAAARRRDVDISDHYSQRMTEELFEESDLVFALAEDHYRILQEFPNAEGKLYMLKAFPESNRADMAHSIEDPIGGAPEEYEATFDEIEREVRRALPEIIRRIGH